MAQEIINVGALPNDGQGDPMRVAFEKINNNFNELFTSYTTVTGSTTTGITPGQVVLQTSANELTTRNFLICSTDSNVENSQSITISVLMNQDRTDVIYTGYGALFFGNPVASYSVDINSGRLRVLVNPLVNGTMYHFIGSQILYNEVSVQ